MEEDSVKLAMVIPSYWARESEVGWEEEDVIYDHPEYNHTEG